MLLVKVLTSRSANRVERVLILRRSRVCALPLKKSQQPCGHVHGGGYDHLNFAEKETKA